MTIHVEDTIDSGIETRIRRIREAFAESRTNAGVQDAPEELVAGFDEIEFEEIVG